MSSISRCCIAENVLLLLVGTFQKMERRVKVKWLLVDYATRWILAKMPRLVNIDQLSRLFSVGLSDVLVGGSRRIKHKPTSASSFAGKMMDIQRVPQLSRFASQTEHNNKTRTRISSGVFFCFLGFLPVKTLRPAGQLVPTCFRKLMDHNNNNEITAVGHFTTHVFSFLASIIVALWSCYRGISVSFKRWIWYVKSLARLLVFIYFFVFIWPVNSYARVPRSVICLAPSRRWSLRLAVTSFGIISLSSLYLSLHTQGKIRLQPTGTHPTPSLACKTEKKPLYTR